MLTAERLFAERGIEAVPLRDIGVAAGQRNHVAVQYHFGDRETLVQAIAAYRAQFLTDVSANLVADLVAGGRTLTVTDFVRATVTALAANLDDESHFLPFISRYIIERGGYGGLEHTVPTGSAATLRSILQRLLPDHTEALLDERWEILFTSAVHTLARYQVMLHDRALPAPIDDLIEDLARVLGAGLEAPAAELELRQASARSYRRRRGDAVTAGVPPQTLTISSTVGPMRSATAWSTRPVEAVALDGVPGDDLAHVVLVDALHEVVELLPGVRPGRFHVRVVGAPHDAVDADLLARAGVDPPDGVGVGRADEALAAEVLARLRENIERRVSSLNGVILDSSMKSMPMSAPGIQSAPCSVNTSLRSGWRSRMPLNVKNHRGRCTQKVDSMAQISKPSKSSSP